MGELLELNPERGEERERVAGEWGIGGLTHGMTICGRVSGRDHRA
jgi:hypothetical protein